MFRFSTGYVEVITGIFEPHLNRVPHNSLIINEFIILHREVILLFFREYKYTREIAAAVVKHLRYRGFDAVLVTPEEYDVSLRARAERVNTWCRQLCK